MATKKRKSQKPKSPPRKDPVMKRLADTFTDFLKNFVMANGLADHELPPAVDRFALDVTP